LPDADVPESLKAKIQRFDGDANQEKAVAHQQHKIPAKCFLDDRTFIIQEKYFKDIIELSACFKFMRAGPRREVVFKREDTRAAIVTCGGLCPGLNVVIKSIVDCLSYEYGVQEIWGIRWGYRGFYEAPEYWVPLTCENVKGIQNLGGTILGSSRGGFDGEKMIAALKEKGINQLYVIGGDGTHRGINNLIAQLREQKCKVSVCGIPKTIDNDIPLIDRSFGFKTSVQESIKSINSALTEAKSAEYGVGIVRLMGRYCGFIAVMATLAARDVNVCLIPEVYFQLYGPDGVYEHVIKIATTRGYCVVVVAEGAEDGLVDEDRDAVRDELGIKEDRVDESGNRKNLDLAKFMVKDLSKYAKRTKNISLTIKYLNPTYAIRTTPANSSDAELCHRLAHTGVHSVQAGFTDFSVGNVRDQPVLIPISLLISQSSRQLKRRDHEYQRVIESNGQPNFLNKENMVTYLAREKDRDIKRRELYLKSKCEIQGHQVCFGGGD
jgi:6-phosphofructokinase 1